MKYDWGEERPPLSRETKNKISACKIGNRNRWKEDLTPKYEEVKKLISSGVDVTCACEAIGITRDQFYRRRRIELNGKDRKK